MDELNSGDKRFVNAFKTIFLANLPNDSAVKFGKWVKCKLIVSVKYK